MSSRKPLLSDLFRCLAVLLAGCAFAAPASAQFAAVGEPILVSPPFDPEPRLDDTHRHDRPVIAPAPDGSYLVAWTRLNPDYFEWLECGILLRRVGVDGSLGPIVELASDLPVEYLHVDVAFDGRGRAFVAWSGRSELGEPGYYATWGRALGADGTPLGPARRLDDGERANSYEPTVDGLPDGGWLVSWTERGDDLPTVTRVQRLGPDAEPLGPPHTLSISGQTLDHWFTVLADGRWLFTAGVWAPTALPSRLFFRLFDADGSPLGGETDSGLFVNGSWNLPGTGLAGGGFALLGLTVDGGDTRTRVALFTAAGEPATASFFLPEADDGWLGGSPAVGALPDGGLLLAWAEGLADQLPEVPDGRLVAQRFDARGRPAGERFTVEPPTPWLIRSTTVQAVGDGALVAWSDWTTGPPRGRLRLRHVEAPCESGPTTLCLGGDRFRVTLTPGFGAPPSLLPEAGLATRRNDDWGHFSLFRPTNVEAVVKILDGRAVNGHSWLFASVLSHLPLAIHVTDTATGTRHRLDTFLGQQTFFDTTAFPAGPHPPLGRRPPPLPPAQGVLGCDEDPFCVSLHDGRIEVEVAHYRGGSQAYSAAWREALTPSAAAFGYSRPSTADVVIKVLDGRPVNGHWWVFVGMLTDRGAEVSVTDNLTGAQAFYFTAETNLTDTRALPAP